MQEFRNDSHATGTTTLAKDTTTRLASRLDVDSTPQIWPYLLLCAAAAAFLDLGHIHRGEQADSIIPVLVSLQRWTFYYWGQDRYGMLLPLLALPFRDPLHNLLVQAWITSFSGLAVFFLVARYFMRSFAWPIVATIPIVYILAFAPPVVQFDWFVAQPYAVPLSLAFGGLLLIETKFKRPKLRGVSLALLMVILANWISASASLVLMPLALFRWLQSGGIRQLTKTVRSPGSTGKELIKQLAGNHHTDSLILLTFGALSGWIMLRRVKHPTTNLGGTPIQQWLTGWNQLFIHCWQTISPTPLCIVCFLAPALLAIVMPLVLPSQRPMWKRSMPIATALTGAALIWWLFTGTRIWVEMNLYEYRYVIPSLFLFITAFAVFAASAIPASWVLRSQKHLASFSAIVLFSMILFRYGTPSISKVRTDVDQDFGRFTPDIIAAQANIITGNYWTVWPTVFYSNLVLYEHGSHRVVYGLCLRSGPTRKFWSKIPLRKVRIAVPSGEEKDARIWLDAYGFRVRDIEHRPTIELFAAASEAH